MAENADLLSLLAEMKKSMEKGQEEMRKGQEEMKDKMEKGQEEMRKGQDERHDKERTTAPLSTTKELLLRRVNQWWISLLVLKISLNHYVSR
ncbi:hypothetical protein AVEN_129856-1 [Araneus ventricosus]|uniref:Uncharacterized protein n=1 Tax=Araneus ventricosus TaxID=182803 RepID=A0A4Y2JD92_ARAVE|nr:hypothetical protein AVEN_129856-1 [Araneus ventricosus]